MHGIGSVEIRSDGPNGSRSVRIGTMFQFKVLEYRRMTISGVLLAFTAMAASIIGTAG